MPLRCSVSFTPPSSSSGVIPDGGRPLIELWVLDAGNRRAAGASGQSYPQHGARGRGAEPVDTEEGALRKTELAASYMWFVSGM